MAFADSDNKQAVRLGWDLPLLDIWSGRAQRKLTYFGLPGPRMLDLIAWRAVLDARRTAVEELPKAQAKRDLADDAAAQMVATALQMSLSDGLQVLRGDVGEILTKGLDGFARRPLMSDNGPAETARFRYDLHNLDFDGGLGFINKSTGEAPRLDALRKLVERQKGFSFLLFLTVNVRNTVGPAIADYLGRLTRQDAGGAVTWYQARGGGEVEHRLKAIVPVLMRNIAESNGFAMTCHPPVAYTGHASARMVHFVLEFRAEDLIFAGVSHQSADDMLKLPMLEALNGVIRLADLQHEQCDMEKCREVLAHFSTAQIDAFLSEPTA
jgi:hypothetical protein